MLEFVAIPQNQPFLVAIFMMLGIALLEGVATLLWGGASQFLDALLPEIDLDVDLDVDADVDADFDANAGHGLDSTLSPEAGLLTPILAWLQVGRVPILVLLVIFLTSFGLVGFAVQGLVAGVLGSPLPAALASIPALAVAIPSLRVFGGAIARVMPKEETSAVSRETFVGRIATIVIGTCKRGAPAQARLRDEHGRSHYVMVEPDLEDAEFSQGSEVLLVAVAGPRFRVIAPPSAALVDAAPTPLTEGEN